jgi:hypothetical protein
MHQVFVSVRFADRQLTNDHGMHSHIKLKYDSMHGHWMHNDIKLKNDKTLLLGWKGS